MLASSRTYVIGMSCNDLRNFRLVLYQLTTAGDLPPSSKTHGLRYFAASLARILPTRSPPVNFIVTLQIKTLQQPEYKTHVNVPDVRVSNEFSGQSR